MVVDSDSRNIDAAVANMLVMTVKIGASLVGVVIPLKAYRYFSG